MVSCIGVLSRLMLGSLPCTRAQTANMQICVVTVDQLAQLNPQSGHYRPAVTTIYMYDVFLVNIILSTDIVHYTYPHSQTHT